MMNITDIFQGDMKYSNPLYTKYKIYIWLSLMVFLWGLSWPATKVVLGVVPPLWLAAIRFGSAAICLFLFLAVRGNLRFPPRSDWKMISSMGILQMMAFTGLGMIAMTHIDTGRAVLLAYTTPLWCVIVSWLVLREVPTKIQFLALAVGIGGIGLILSPLEMDWTKPGTFIGAVFLLIGAICWSIVILHVKHHRWTATPLELAPWQMLLATIPLATVAYAVEGMPTHITWNQHLLSLLFFIGPIATSACFVISAEYGRRISTFAMSNFTLGVPLIGILASTFVFNTMLTPLFLCGLGFIVLAVILSTISSR